MTTKFDYLVYSDIHFGHRKTRIDNTIRSIENIWKEPWFRDLKAIFIAGDIYDRKLDHGSYDATEATLHLIRLGYVCFKYNIELYILEGTPSHDWKQAQSVPELYRHMKIPITCHYIDKVTIKYSKALEKYILFIPDEIDTPTNVFDMVKEAVHSKELDKVDITIMHGAFRYQQSGAPEEYCHLEMDYLAITRYLIHPGHIHQHTHYKRIVAQGSIDRYTHGDEDPKGYVVVRNNTDWMFYTNPTATKYVTIPIQIKTLDEARSVLSKQIQTLDLPKNSHIRLQIPKNSPIPSLISEIRTQFPYYHITFIREKVVEEEKPKRLLEAKEYDSIQLTPDNIIDIVMKKLNSLDVFSTDPVPTIGVGDKNASESLSEAPRGYSDVRSEYKKLLSEIISDV